MNPNSWSGRGTQQQKEARGRLQGPRVDDGDEQQDEGGRPQADEEGAGRRQGAAEGRRRGPRFQGRGATAGKGPREEGKRVNGLSTIAQLSNKMPNKFDFETPSYVKGQNDDNHRETSFSFG